MENFPKNNIDKPKPIIEDSAEGKNKEKIVEVIEKEDAQEREIRLKELFTLAEELEESREVFPFSGIDQETYLRMKIDEKDYEEYGILATPIDELIERFEAEGMKVVLGDNPETGNIFILPSQSDDFMNDSILVEKLKDNEDLDERIKRLISISMYRG